MRVVGAALSVGAAAHFRAAAASSTLLPFGRPRFFLGGNKDAAGK